MPGRFSLVVLFLLIGAAAVRADDLWQMPVALGWSSADRLAVVTRDGQSFHLIDTSRKAVLSSRPLDAPAQTLARDSLTKNWLVGTRDGWLLELGPDGTLTRKAEIGRGPVSVLPWGPSEIVAAARWDRRILVLDRERLQILREHPLPFSSGAMLDRGDGRVVVADAFGGTLATLDPSKPGSVRGGTLDGVRMQGLSLSPLGPEVLVGHMDQYNTVPVTSTNLDWGLVFTSRLSAIRLADLDEGSDLSRKLPRRRLILDGSGNGAADPSAIAQNRDGSLVLIACSGAGTVLFIERNPRIKDELGRVTLGESQTTEAVEVGRRPLSLAISPDGTMAATADASDGAVSLIDLKTRKVVATIRLSPRSQPDPVQRGEAAFHDARLALDRWISCASCHVDGHTNGLNFDTLGDGGYGSAKNTPTLLGSAGTAPYAWNGRFATLEEQIGQSFDTSLRGGAGSPGLVADVSAYLRSLTVPPPRRRAQDTQVIHGARIFKEKNCAECHAPPSYTIKSKRDGGIGEESRQSELYNPPSLRGVGWTAPYFHDGRARTLADVLRVHPPGHEGELSQQDAAALIDFLESL